MRVDGLHHQTSQEQEEASNLVQKRSDYYGSCMISEFLVVCDNISFILYCVIFSNLFAAGMFNLKGNHKLCIAIAFLIYDQGVPKRHYYTHTIQTKNTENWKFLRKN